MGFSAGGHLACSLSTLYNEQVIKDNKKTVAAYMDSVSKGLTAIDFKRVNLNQD